MATRQARLSAIALVLTASATVVGCKSEDKDKDEDEGSTASEDTGSVATTSGGSATTTASSVKDLGISSALEFEISEAIRGTGSSALRLLTGEKSAEACRIRQSIRQSTDMLSGIRMSLCHIEAEADVIPFNQPTLLSMSGLPAGGGGDGGPELPEDDAPDAPDGDMPELPDGTDQGPPELPLALTQADEQLIGIFVDSSTPDAIKVYMCSGTKVEDLELTQVFEVTGSRDQRSKGSMILSHSMGGMTFGASAAFDAGYTTPGTFALQLKANMSMDFNGTTGSMNNYLKMKLVDGGVSVVESSDSGTWMGDDMQNAGFARFDASNGQVLFSLNATNGGESFRNDIRSCVDAEGYLVDCSDAKFEKDGALYVAPEEVPGFLASDFAADAPSGFDCASASWTKVSLDMNESTTSAKHDACMESAEPFEQEDCWDVAYGQSSEEVTIPEERDELPPAPLPEEDLISE
jgi:hypothetical protein